jgi:hypothetical protein
MNIDEDNPVSISHARIFEDQDSKSIRCESSNTWDAWYGEMIHGITETKLSQDGNLIKRDNVMPKILSSSLEFPHPAIV